MSQPEWMQKFKEIGQKSQRVDADGNVIVESMDDKFKKPPSVANSSIPPWMKKKNEEKNKTMEETDDDAAALFAAAASKPAVIKTEEEIKDEEDAAALFAAAGTTPAVVKTEEEEEDVAALFAAAGSAPAVTTSASGGLTDEEEEMVTKYKKMLKMGMPEGAVIQKMAVDEVPKNVQDAVLAPAPPPAEETPNEQETLEEEIIEEEVIEESVVSSSVVEETLPFESAAATNPDNAAEVVQSNEPKPAEQGAAASSSPTESDQKMSDEEFGDTWVVNRERIINELSTTQFEEVEVDRDTGNVHYEEVFIDENGNEVVQRRDEEREMVRENLEDIFVDENGNEVEYEEESEVEYEDDDEDEDERDEVVRVQEEEAIISATAQVREVKDEESDQPIEPPYDPDNDVENQLKLLNRRSKAYRSRMAPWVPYVFLFGFIVAAILILFLVVLADDDGLDIQSVPTASPTPKNFLPLEPTNTGAIDVSATTPMEPVVGNCALGQYPQPNVIDQCFCTGSISIIADDVRQRYDSLLETFMPTVIPDFDQPIDSCDASNQALVWLSSGINNGGEAQDFVRRERYALAYFYMDQGGVGWANNELWISDVDACQWDRVSCDQNSRVVSVDISNNRVIGQLSSAISLMENIESFSAASNTLVGTIPPEIFDTPKLRSLDLSSNGLAGGVPPFPANSTLEIINFASNDLSGEIQTTLGEVKALSSLNLAGNTFNGAIPTELLNLPLQELYLESNDLSGTIPDAIANLTGLMALTLGPNKFSGDIPVAIGSLSNLTRLVIDDVPELTGRLPAEYGLGLTNLVEFVLKDTNVRGNIPQQFGLMTALEILDLSRNSLGRAIPTELGLLTNLKTLKLESNAFSGTVPTQIGNAVELTDLQLQVNQLIGTIPSSIGRLSNLVTLALDGNFLEGRAPEDICDLREINLNKFTVDCPQRVNDAVVVGVICSIPSCCTECF